MAVGRARPIWNRRWLVLLVVPVIAGIAVAVTFVFSSGSTTGAGANAVQIQGFAFHPPTITVKAGSRITVTNADGTTHTLTAQRGAFDTGDIKGGATASITAPVQPGTYQYRCNIHQYMSGMLRVGP